MSASKVPFTVRLRDPADRARFWFWDPSHFPRPVTPAAESFDLPAMAQGFAAAAAELCRPLAGQHIRVERGYVYFGIDLPPSAADLALRERSYRAIVEPRMGTALADWTDRYGPEARRLTTEIERLARSGTSGAAHNEALDAAVTLRAQQWRIHDLALVPAMEAAARFSDRYEAFLGGAVETQTLLQGFPNQATAAAGALESLAEQVRGRPAVAERLLAGEWLSLDTFGATADGPWFVAAARDFLAEYGRRAEAWDVGAQTWAENPAPVFALIADYLRRPSAQPGDRRRQAVAAREAAVARALGRLSPEDRPAFLASLSTAQAYVVVSEDHNARIDQEGMAALRDVLLAAGRHLATAGQIRRAEDVVWLTKAELAGVLAGGQPTGDRVARRRAWNRRRAALTPPRAFGRALPAWAADNPTLARFFGLGAEPTSAPGRLDGLGVSPGTAEGRACVVRSLDEIASLEPGDILVSPMTSPAWTPWLGLIAGAVVETGGMLSHTAILARECGVPCVVNARGATETIPHGTTVRIDGSAGWVTW